MSTLKDILDKARRVIVRKGTAAQDAEDIVHDAYLRVREFERREQVKSEEALIVTTAKNLAHNLRRKTLNSPVITAGEHMPVAVDDRPAVDDVMLAQERLRQLADGLGQLSERSRRILLSRRIDGKSFKEIAAEENMTVAAVEKQVARATLELLKWVGQ